MRLDCDLASLLQLAREISSGSIRLSLVERKTASPFAADLLWQKTGDLMYQDDTPVGDVVPDLYGQVAASSRLRPSIPPEIAAELEQRLQRTAPGYSPADGRELVAWIDERRLISPAEWEALLEAVARDHGEAAARVGPGQLAALPLGDERFVTSRRSLRLIATALADDPGPVTDPVAPAGRIPMPRPRGASPGAESRAAASASREALVRLLVEWLRYHGPVPLSRVRALASLGLAPAEEVLADLQSEGDVIVDRILADAEEEEVCDRRNLERLLGLLRRRAQPSLAPLSIESLPFFLAEHQRIGLCTSESAKAALEPLLMHSLPAGLWETEILPARIDRYSPRVLDDLVHDTDLIWLGTGKEKIAFCFHADLALVATGTSRRAGTGEAESLLPDPLARYRFWDLQRATGLPSGRLAETLWRLAWEGSATTDDFRSVRLGLAARFRAEDAARETTGRRLSFDRWNRGRPTGAGWLRLEAPQPADELEESEIEEARITVLLDRYGVVFRELLEREMPLLRWSRVFRGLRLLELAGRVVSGRFFEGVPGPQFAAPDAVARIRAGLASGAGRVYWMNAVDPASPCGLALDDLKGRYPRRTPSNRLVFRGTSLVITIERGGSQLTFHVPAEQTGPEILAPLREPLEREVLPVRKLRILRINGRPAAHTPYAEPMVRFGFLPEGDVLTLRPRVL
jgi:ATP-dependent Lhr-like helicase